MLKLYKVYFWATKTEHGKEQTRLHAVYMPRRDETTGKTLTIEEQITRGTEALKKENLYNIKYGSTIATELIFA